jgi:hypothetical protein
MNKSSKKSEEEEEGRTDGEISKSKVRIIYVTRTLLKGGGNELRDD